LCKNCSALIFCLPDSFPESARFKYKDFANLKHAPVLINFSGDFIWQKKDMQTLKDDTIISDYITASLLI